MKRALLTSLLVLAAIANGQVSSSTKHKSATTKFPASENPQQPGSTDEPAPSTPPKPPVHVGPDIKATDAERAAVTFTAYDLDVRLVPAQQSIAVRALLKVRNDGDLPLVHLPLQISSSLEWETVRIAGKEAPFGLQTINSDADHTGQLREAIVVLPEPLAAGKQAMLDVVYRGTIELGSKRLEAIGTPADLAQRSDWDRIAPEFTGLRGFGNVAWYPVSSVPVFLGDGAKLFTESGKQKLRQSSATVAMKVSVEYLGKPPNLAVLNGHPVAVGESADTIDPDTPLIATCTLPPTPLGFASPSLIVASLVEQAGLRSSIASGTSGPRINAYLRAGDEPNIDPYLNAMAKITPLLEQWLGTQQKTPLTLVDLPEPDDAPFETGSVLLMPISAPAASDQLTNVMAHALTHSYLSSPREWLNEGAAYFLGTLWTEQSAGRDAALQSLASSPLALAEPASPADGGQDLMHAIDPIYYRTKAAYVFWMLRNLVGDAQLSAALRDYDPALDTTPEYFETLLERRPQDGGAKKDLKWFFDDWVYRDRGLPDLSIESVFPSKSAAAGSYIVAVNLANEGYAAAEVPVTIRSSVTSTTERLIIPARQKISHRMLIQGYPVEVALNDGTVPEMQTSVHVKAVAPSKEQH